MQSNDIGSCLRALCLVTCLSATNQSPVSAGNPTGSPTSTTSQSEARPYSGLTLKDDPAGRAVVYHIAPGPLGGRGSKAAQLKRGDILEQVNGQPTSTADFRAKIAASRIGDEIVLLVRRAPGAQTSSGSQPTSDQAPTEIRFRIADQREWLAPVNMPRDVSNPDAKSLHTNESPVASPATQPVSDPDSAFESWIESRLAANAISEPVQNLTDLLARTQARSRGPNSLSRVEFGFAHPFRLGGLQRVITDPLPQVITDPQRAIEVMAANLDVALPATQPAPAPPNTSADDLAGWTVERLDAADDHLSLAFAAIDVGEHDQLRRSILEHLRITGQPSSFESVVDDPRPLIRALQLSTRIDYRALLLAANELVSVAAVGGQPAANTPTTQPDVSLPPELNGAVTGSVLALRRARRGWVVVGGPGPNSYDLSRLAGVIDVGGNDSYRYPEGPRPRAQVVVDLAGDDRYSTETSAVGPAAAAMGVSILVDASGNDEYQGSMLSCGAGAMGIGLLLDRAGDDRYSGSVWCEGAGVYGAGALIDLAGSDAYVAHNHSQAIGGPRGFGLILDAAGNDLYRANGPTPSVYDTPGVFYSMSQGVGFGFRWWDNGGIGVLEDCAGDDRYEGGEFSQGGAYYFALGILHDRAGRDAYYGNRYSQGFAAHQALGVLADDAGDDMYFGMTAASQAGAWDESVTMLIDRAGNDTHRADGLSQGSAAMQAIAMLVDLGGDDHYIAAGSANQGEGAGNSYHFGESRCLSFSLLLDAGGSNADVYSSQRKNNMTATTGAANEKQPEDATLHGLFIDTALTLEAP